MASVVEHTDRAGTPTSRWLRVVQGELFAYRRVWKGSVFSSVVLPMLYLGAFGLGLGALVERGGGQLESGATFLEFVAPGMLAASAFQIGMGETMWPARGGVSWFGHYRALTATGVGINDFASGMLAWHTLRLVVTALPYALAAILFGAVAPLRAVAMIGPALLLGSAAVAAALFVAWWAKTEELLSLTYRLGIVPAFLLSGAFFPVSGLPPVVRVVTFLNPVYHGVELTRIVALGTAPTVAPWISLLFISALIPIFGVAATRALRKRLQP